MQQEYKEADLLGGISKIGDVNIYICQLTSVLVEIDTTLSMHLASHRGVRDIDIPGSNVTYKIVCD